MDLRTCSIAVALLANSANIHALDANLAALPALPVVAAYPGAVSRVPSEGESVGMVYGRNARVRVVSEVATRRDRELEREISALLALLPPRLRPIETAPWDVGFGEMGVERSLQQEIAKLLQRTEYGEVGRLAGTSQASAEDIDAAIGVLIKMNPSLRAVPMERLRSTVLAVQVQLALVRARETNEDWRNASLEAFRTVPSEVALNDTYLRPGEAQGVCTKYEKMFRSLKDGLSRSITFRTYVELAAEKLGIERSDPGAVQRIASQWQAECREYEVLAQSNDLRRKLADDASSAATSGDASAAAVAFNQVVDATNLSDNDKISFKNLRVRLRSVSVNSEQNSARALENVYWAMRSDRPRLRYEGKLLKVTERGPKYTYEQLMNDTQLLQARVVGRASGSSSGSERLKLDLLLFDRLSKLEAKGMVDGLPSPDGVALLSISDPLLHERHAQGREIIYQEIGQKLAELRALRELTVLRDGNGAAEPEILGVVVSVMKAQGELVAPGDVLFTFSPSMGREIVWTQRDRPSIGHVGPCKVKASGPVPLSPADDAQLPDDVRSSVRAFLGKASTLVATGRRFQCTVLNAERTWSGYEITAVVEDVEGYALDVTELAAASDSRAAVKALSTLGLVNGGPRTYLLLLAGSLPLGGSASVELIKR